MVSLNFSNNAVHFSLNLGEKQVEIIKLKISITEIRNSLNWLSNIYKDDRR